MNPARRDTWFILAAALAYGGLVFGLLPSRPIAMNDDFGYLRSILETIWHGRPWTDDFLEPWSLSLSAASVGIFKATGSFFCATIGLQAVLAAVSFGLVCRLAREAGGGLAASIGVAAVLLTFPTMLWKQIEFTAVVVCVPCLFCAIWAANRNKWALFFLAWAIAVASRQSAVAWLVLPGLIGVEAAIRERSVAKLKGPAGILLLGVCWFWLLQGYANETHAQRFITQRVLPDMNPADFRRNLKLGAWILAVAIGCAALLLPRRPAGGRPGWLARMGGLGMAVVLLATLPLVANQVAVSFEHQLFENTWAVGYLRGLVVLAAIGWLWVAPTLRLPFIGAAVAALVLTCLRNGLWDYYLIDGALMAFFAVGPGAPSPAEPVASLSWWRRGRPAVAAVATLGIVGFQLAATEPLKRHIDGSEAGDSLLEHALRAGRIKPSELSSAPFGFVGWHLLPYYLKHEGRASGDVAGFNNYVGRDSIDVPVEPLSRKEARTHPTANDPAHPFSEIHQFGWFGRARWTLIRQAKAQPPVAAIRGEEYQPLIFPLNDAEWRELTRGRSRP
jgi:hypothetical protein